MKIKTFFAVTIILFVTQIVGCNDEKKSNFSMENQAEERQTVEISSMEEKESIKKFIAKYAGSDTDKKMKVKCKLINSFGLKQILSYRLFKVIILKEKSKGSFSGKKIFLAKKGEEIIEIEVPQQNGISMSALLELIDKKNKIKNVDDAQIFFDAFSILHRNFRGYLRTIDGKKKQEIICSDNEWIFVFNGGVFDRESFIVKTDNDGKILNIIFDINPSGSFFKKTIEPKIYPEVITGEEIIHF
ncbi:hypothetical protein [Candidatus Electronema sp. JM]|uniref:hypothetical protein n=1 Tax=Candidatus Electronema sp. JM TaxID=3401571 RepID=UPI003AA9879C